MHGSGGGDGSPVEARFERLEIREQRAPVVGEAEPAPVRERLVVRQLDVQRDVLEPVLAEKAGQLPQELPAATLPASLGAEIDEADVTEAVAELRLRQADDPTLCLGDDDSPFPQIRVGKRRWVGPRPVLIQVRGHELLHGRKVAFGGFANDHVAPASNPPRR
jgi:hypothetical protein